MEIGAVMRALGAGRVDRIQKPRFAVGDHVTGVFGVEEYAVSNGQGLMKVDVRSAPLPVYVQRTGRARIHGLFGLLDVGQAKSGETVVISGAAGAVGTVAGQIAKIKDCRVIGIAGGPEKCDYVVKDLGFDACIDYKVEGREIGARRALPKGVDVYFDNVGGEILDAVLLFLSRRARVVICGAISQYNNTTPVKGPSNYLSLLVEPRADGRLRGLRLRRAVWRGAPPTWPAGSRAASSNHESTWSRASKRSRKTCSSFTPAKTLASSFCRSPMSNLRTPE